MSWVYQNLYRTLADAGDERDDMIDHFSRDICSDIFGRYRSMGNRLEDKVLELMLKYKSGFIQLRNPPLLLKS